ncbi:hypothetical protein JK364_52070 [Streptomyces sp. 110]|uniref:Uncharacterized protein n=1 Tax=Streptomyces endocoffeicus TaxID=2898945 RepID=A0ABS1Q9C5_9ACTN|nr:hypothetical protein [Streptomyces endocoffeicus]MBL1120742.1 hypothetical protein [Streptomyces endocoffeicus]
MKYPTRTRAFDVLAEARGRLTRLHGHAAETRAYRCEADDRVWHLTSKIFGYEYETPLANAYELADQYRRTSRRKNK